MTFSNVPAGVASGGRPIRRYVLIWLAIIIVVVMVGSAGFVMLGGWSLSDALYMAVITLTTVGFREVRELDDIGRAWTMLLSLTGVGIIFGTVGLVAEAFLAEAISGRRARRQMAHEIARLRGHFILCGYGRVGKTVARELRHSDVQYVVVDINPRSVEEASRDGELVVEGDGTGDEVLQRAGIERARGLITTTDSDANNVYVTLSARSLNRELFIVARANDEAADSKLRQAGADRVVSPYSRAGRQIAELATRPRVADFIDYALSHGDLAFSIEEIEVAEDGPLSGKSVGELVERGIHTLAIVHGPRDFEANPDPRRELVTGDQLIISGTSEVLRPLRREV
jgi:voltage-gated potassium channel